MLQKLVLLSSNLDMISVELGVESFKRVVFNPCISQTTLNAPGLQVFHAIKRFFKLGSLRDICLTNQFLNSALLGCKAKSREKEEVEIGWPEVVAAIQIQLS